MTYTAITGRVQVAQTHQSNINNLDYHPGMRVFQAGLWAMLLAGVVACGPGPMPMLDGGTAGGSATGGGNATGGGAATGGGVAGGGAGDAGVGPQLGGCEVFPPNHVFNTPIDTLPVHPNSAAFMATIGNHAVHLDLGRQEDTTAADYYGIPFNLVNGATLGWSTFRFEAGDTMLDWDPRPEADCAVGPAHTLISPCVATTAPAPQLPIPPSPLVEGGVVADGPSAPYGDHHLLMLDTASCRLWEAYHAYTGASGTWHLFGTASFDLRSNALRPAGWTSADAAGFPIVPLLLRPDEASTGVIRHALRFTIPTGSIRNTYVWPARHINSRKTSTDLPPMGQLFRLKASYAIPTTVSAQSRAILQALKTYGMYLSDGGSAMYVQGVPSAAWSEAVFSEVQAVNSSQFEAVDVTPFTQRPGFDANSAAVPSL